MSIDNLKKILPLTLKIVFSLTLIAWLLHQNKLDFFLVIQSLRQGWGWLLGMTLLVIQYIGSAIRWKILLQTKTSRHLPLRKTIGVTWIGLFFNSFLPGSVTGDIIKVFYAKKLDPHFAKSFLLTSIFIDRFIGLLGLLAILGISCLIYHRQILSINSEMTQLLILNASIFTLSLISILILFFAPPLVQQFTLALAKKIPLFGDKLSSLVRQIWFMGEHKKILMKTFVLSVGLQLLNIIAFYSIAAPFFDKEIPLYYAITFIPLGMISIAIPISPAGMGVGHIIFDKLFAYAGISGGASLFNLYFLASISLNSLGLIPYVLNNKK